MHGIIIYSEKKIKEQMSQSIELKKVSHQADCRRAWNSSVYASLTWGHQTCWSDQPLIREEHLTSCWPLPGEATEGWGTVGLTDISNVGFAWLQHDSSGLPNKLKFSYAQKLLYLATRISGFQISLLLEDVQFLKKWRVVAWRRVIFSFCNPNTSGEKLPSIITVIL